MDAKQVGMLTLVGVFLWCCGDSFMSGTHQHMPCAEAAVFACWLTCLLDVVDDMKMALHCQRLVV